MLSRSLADERRTVKNLSHPTCTSRAEVQEVILCLVISARTVNTFASHSLLGAELLTFLSFLLMISLLKMVPKQRAQMLTGVPGACGENSCVR